MHDYRGQSHKLPLLLAGGLWIIALVCLAAPAFAQKPKTPAIRAVSAIAIDAQTGTVLYTKNADTPLPPASTTKIVTGLLLAKHPNPDDPVPISSNAAKTPGSGVGLKAGQMVRAQDLLHAVLLTSANDASTAAAEFLDGSVPAFVERMNAEARNLNAPQTRFRNPHGLQNPQHISTARDLANLARAAMQNPQFAAAVAQSSALFPRPNQPAQTLANTNTLLGNYRGMEGVKTGWTPEAGYCFVGSATRSGRRIITVVLNSPDWQAETCILLDYGFAQKPNASSSEEFSERGTYAEARSDTPSEPEPAQRPDAITRKTEPSSEKPLAQTENTGYTRTPSAYGRQNASTEQISSKMPSRNWLWLLLLLLLWLLWAGRKKMASLFENWASLRRKNREQSTTHPSSAKKKTQFKHKIGSDFVYKPPKLPRRSAASWLNHVGDNPNRLLEPAVKRHAQAVLSAQKRPELDKLTELLASPQAKIRLVAAELLLPFLPRRAEETLLAIVQEDKMHAETRAEAIQALSHHGGDRYERHWLQMLLKDGSLSAANALARLPIIEDQTTQTLNRILTSPQAVKKGFEQETKLKMLSAASAAVLATHGKIEAEDADEFVQNLPENHREQTLATLTKHAESEWTIKNWLDMALAGKGHSVLPSLMDADTAPIREYLDAVPEDDPVVRTRALILRWFLLHEGDGDMVRQAASAGETLAMGAVTLDRLHRWNPNNTAPDVLLASLQVVSARLGYTAHSSEQIATAFRPAEGEQADEDARDLKPLGEAYAHPAVHDAVQTALHTENGLSQILTALAQQTDNANCVDECRFWQDKSPDEARLILSQNLRTDASTEHAEPELPVELPVATEPLVLDHAA